MEKSRSVQMTGFFLACGHGPREKADRVDLIDPVLRGCT